MAQNVYSVKQINAYIKRMFTQDYMLNRVYVKGEVSNCKYHSSGHIYFSLKDESGTIACVMFSGQRDGLSFRMKEGQEIIAYGNIDVYEQSGKYQLIAKKIRLDGEGELYERFLLLKNELYEMGMFAPEYKRPIPAYVTTVGVVTASTGAAVHDIIRVSRSRNPYIQLILYPAQVQGIGAKESIVKGIQTLEKMQVDVMIVGRGGGSIEELWAFNEEEVARAIFDCSVPIISAVGHETDYTIADYVADRRAATPSEAAQIAVYELDKVCQKMEHYDKKLRMYMSHSMDVKKYQCNAYRNLLETKHPRHTLEKQQQKRNEYAEKIRMIMEREMIEFRHCLQVYVERMKRISPLDKLNQGFSYVQDERGDGLKSIHQVKKGERLSVYVADGIIYTTVDSKESQEGVLNDGKESGKDIAGLIS